MVLQIYVDPLSPPSRAIMLLVRVNNLEYEENIISIQQGQHRTPDYAKVNKFQKMPSIIHDEFHLSESVAILTYLTQSFPVEENWLPKDPQVGARVNEYMAWHHAGIRAPSMRYMQALLLPHLWGDSRPTSKDIENYKATLEFALDSFENIWLETNEFVAGDEISIADLLAIGEIENSTMTGFDPLEGRPKLTEYMSRARERLGEDLYDEIHGNLRQVSAIFKAKLSQ